MSITLHPKLAYGGKALTNHLLVNPMINYANYSKRQTVNDYPFLHLSSFICE